MKECGPRDVASREPWVFPNNAPLQQRNDRNGRPATVDADSAHSSVAQAFEAQRLAIVREAGALFRERMRAMRALAKCGL